MKMLVGFCVILALALIGAEAQEYALGFAVESLTCTKVGAECAADCTTVMMCLAKDGPPKDSVTCASATPYCVNGACATKPSATCIPPPVFDCADEGIYPEPTDCTRYRVCNASSEEPPGLFQCPTGFVFNSKLNLCQKGTSPCSKISCSTATAAKPYFVYASNPQFYVYCFISGGKTDTYMFKCGEAEIFDTAINDCRLSCSAKGNFQKPGNCNQYYYCSSSTAKPSEIIDCPPEYVFDGTGCNKDATKCQFPPE